MTGATEAAVKDKSDLGVRLNGLPRFWAPAWTKDLKTQEQSSFISVRLWDSQPRSFCDEV